ncbi:hypothetical protein [Flavobacterium rhizosphaerae]|uniref:Secreted protein n=1 Tax=Flavobacterium rhizosphaerae TaxID=3163298 RepID=A0ABW8YUZ1_9FLAO
MKFRFIKKALFVSLFLTAFSVTSCKDNKDAEENMTTMDTVAPDENVNQTPADTIITDNDTVVEMGTDTDLDDFQTGKQVP